MLTSGFGRAPLIERRRALYRVNPFAPVDDIVETLLLKKSAQQAEVDLGLSFAVAMHESNSEALLRLALAHYVWRNDKLDAETMAEMVTVMKWQGVRKPAKP